MGGRGREAELHIYLSVYLRRICPGINMLYPTGLTYYIRCNPLDGETGEGGWWIVRVAKDLPLSPRSYLDMQYSGIDYSVG